MARRSIFALIVALHLAAVFLWPHHRQGKGGQQEREMHIVFVAPPVARVKPGPVAARAAPRVKAAPRRADPAPSAAPEMTLVLPPEEPAPVWDPAAPAPTRADVLARARKDMADIDRAVRKDSLQMSVREFKPGPTPMEKAIASAYAGHGNGTRITEIVLPDGSRMSKVTMGKVTFCVQSVSNTLAGALNGPSTRITNCPS